MHFSAKPLQFHAGGNPQHLLWQAREGGDWRTTVVALVQLGNKFLVPRVRKFRKQCRIEYRKDILKGGVEHGQTLTDALRTELFEEARIRWTEVLRSTYLGYALVPFDKHNRGRDGYRRGKLYLIYHVVLERGARFCPGKDHGVQHLLWRSDYWSYFRKPRGKQTKKYKILSDPLLRRRLIALRRV